MQTKFNLYPKEQLPENFKFPQSYIDLSSNMEKINELEYFPWWFEDPDYENSEIEDSVYLYSKDNKYECKDFDEWLAEEITSAKEY